LAAQLPRKVAMHMMLTGDAIDARTAHAYGLVNDVVPDGQVVEAALELAEAVCTNAPLAVQATKRIAYGAAAGTWAGEESYWDLTTQESGAVRRSQDANEGPRAFAEKRAPSWTGR
jgi:crotonobetainyl-CoA hydratase